MKSKGNRSYYLCKIIYVDSIVLSKNITSGSFWIEEVSANHKTGDKNGTLSQPCLLFILNINIFMLHQLLFQYHGAYIYLRM